MCGGRCGITGLGVAILINKQASSLPSPGSPLRKLNFDIS